MEMISLIPEIRIQTTRSGGRGGQNVNKVETAVIASLDIEASTILSPEQKELIREKLASRISNEGVLMVKSQTHRSQLQNRDEAVKRIQKLVSQALYRKKLRIATRPSRASREKRKAEKQHQSQRKQNRRFRPGDDG